MEYSESITSENRPRLADCSIANSNLIPAGPAVVPRQTRWHNAIDCRWEFWPQATDSLAPRPEASLSANASPIHRSRPALKQKFTWVCRAPLYDDGQGCQRACGNNLSAAVPAYRLAVPGRLEA